MRISYGRLASSTLLSLLVTSCLALQDQPTRGVGEECVTHDWCNEDLKCIYERIQDVSANGECAPSYACYHDIECPTGALCDGARYGTPGNCMVNTGCQTNADCGTRSCFRGRCYTPCTTSSQCSSGFYCERLDCPQVTPLDDCPMGCN